MATTGKTVRDFIYVDIDRLYSLSSQLFEGVADQIVQSYMDAASSKKSQGGAILKGGNIEEQVAEMSRVTENKILHDHMYNLLETALSEAIYIPSGITRANYRANLANAFIVKVRGKAEISDFGRAGAFIQEINSLAESFATLSLFSDEIIATKALVEEAIKSMPNSPEKQQLKQQMNKFRDAKTFAKESGWTVDEKMTEALTIIMRFLYPDIMQITIIPENEIGEVVFSGVLDKRWLRIKPEFLRALYGGAVEWTWTMVGQLTYLPKETPLTQEDINNLIASTPAPPSEAQAPQQALSMRTPIQTLFERLRLFERFALEAAGKVEIIVSPVAIYREMAIRIAS